MPSTSDSRQPAAAVEVVELALGHRVVDVDRRERQAAFLGHLVQAFHTGGRLFGDTLDLGQPRRIPGRARGELGLDRPVQRLFFLAGRVRDDGSILLGLAAQVQQQCRVAAVVEDHVGVAAIGPLEDTVRVVPVVVERFALDGEHGRAGGRDRGGGVVLRRIDIAAGPAHFRAECPQRFNQHGGLDRHVQRPGDARTAQRLLLGELVADGDQARHFRFGNADFLAAPVCKLDVGDDIVGASRGRFEYGAHLAPSFSCQRSGRAPFTRPADQSGAGAPSLAGRLSDNRSCRNAPRGGRGL